MVTPTLSVATAVLFILKSEGAGTSRAASPVLLSVLGEGDVTVVEVVVGVVFSLGVVVVLLVVIGELIFSALRDVDWMGGDSANSEVLGTCVLVGMMTSHPCLFSPLAAVSPSSQQPYGDNSQSLTAGVVLSPSASRYYSMLL